jgi:hypothetical protein
MTSLASLGSLGLAVIVTPAVALLAGGSATAARTSGFSRHIPMIPSLEIPDASGVMVEWGDFVLR